MSAKRPPTRITISRMLYLLGGTIGLGNGVIELGPDASPDVQAIAWPLIVSGTAALVLVVLLRRPRRWLPIAAAATSTAMVVARILQAGAVGSPLVMLACILPVVALLGVVGAEGRAWTRTTTSTGTPLAADRNESSPTPGLPRRLIGGLGAVGILAVMLGLAGVAGVAAAVVPCSLPGPAARSGLDTTKGASVSNVKPTGYVKASDGVQLAYYSFVPKSPTASLVFYHGSGANSTAGYLAIGKALRAQDIAVYLFDIRGHGASGGPRGDTPSTLQLEHDTATAVTFVHHQHSEIPEFIGGHSAGAGVVLNSASLIANQVAGYVFLAPDFGLHSGTERQDEASNFATICQRPLIAATITNGLLGAHLPAVSFAYTPAQIDAGMVPQYTAAMAIAQNADDSATVLAKLGVPVGVWIGSDDEVFDANRVRNYTKEHGGEKADATILPGLTHLGILNDPAPMGQWILSQVQGH